MRLVKAALLFLAFLCINFSLHAASSDCQQHQCVAVVDAGSTGSRLHIYAYDIDNTNTPVNIKELWSKKIKPGLATIEANQPTIDAYLTTLLADAPQKNLPIYFYSTAGMRLLPGPRQQKFYTLLQKWFAAQDSWQLKRAKTITGTDEGLYGWLSVNYQLDTLHSSGKKDSVGVMDMGGASVQIVFPVNETEGIKPNDIQKLDLYGQKFTLFIHSFLGLGQTEVSHQFLDSSACFANNYELPTGFPAAGDVYSCEKEVSSLMRSVHHVNQVVQPAIQTNPINKWVVMGGAAELAKTKPFQFDKYQFTNQSLLEQANMQVCRHDWTALSSQYPGDDYLYGYCLFPAYYYALMVEGYGIQPQQPISYLAASQSSDWTLGVVVLHQSA